MTMSTVEMCVRKSQTNKFTHTDNHWDCSMQKHVLTEILGNSIKCMFSVELYCCCETHQFDNAYKHFTDNTISVLLILCPCLFGVCRSGRFYSPAVESSLVRRCMLVERTSIMKQTRSYIISNARPRDEQANIRNIMKKK